MEFTKITPYLRYPDGDAAAEWLTRVFGFGPARCVRDEHGAWREGDLAVGPTMIAISGGGPPASAYLIVTVPDVDAQHRKIIEAGVDVAEPQDKPYGPRTLAVTDPWGTTWDFWQGDAEF